MYLLSICLSDIYTAVKKLVFVNELIVNFKLILKTKNQNISLIILL